LVVSEILGTAKIIKKKRKGVVSEKEMLLVILYRKHMNMSREDQIRAGIIRSKGTVRAED
jgi:hypothetical protein